MKAVLADPGLREKLAGQDMAVVDNSEPATFGARIAQEVKMWQEVVSKQNLKLE